MNQKLKKYIFKNWEEGSSIPELVEETGYSKSHIYQIIIYFPYDSPAWHKSIPKTKYTCLSCSKKFFDRKKSKLIICSNCYDLYFKRQSGTCLEGMDFIREIARIRDKHTCQECGRKWEYGTRRFDIHHLSGDCGARSRKYDKNIENLTTLCHKCHLNLDEVRERMSSRSSPRPLKDGSRQQI